MKRGSVSVTIYETPTRGYPSYTLAYYQDGQRQRESSSDYMSLQSRAEEVLSDLNEGRPAEAGFLKTADRTEYVRANDTLKSKGIKLPVDVAVRHYAEAVKILGTDLVIEAAREYAKRHPQKMPQKSVAEIVDGFIEAKQAQGVSRRYMEDLNYRLGRFKRDFQSNIAHVDGDQIRLFLAGLNLSPRSYNNFRLALITLFEFAKKRKYLSTDWDEFGSVEKMKGNGGAIEIFAPEEISKLLAAASFDLIPFLVIGAFAGLRSAEIERLDWRDVKFESGFVIIEAAKAKTASRRQVEMHPNLRAWLKPYAKKEGRVYPHNDDWLYKMLRKASATAKVPWKHNALRHSYISYRVAESGDVNRTALEAGNSAAMIFSNYRELVSPQEAKRWFLIMPTNLLSNRK